MRKTWNRLLLKMPVVFENGMGIANAITNPVINTGSPLPAATLGSAYSVTLQGALGLPPYTWSISGQTGSNGWALNASTGALTATPTASETDLISVSMLDSASHSAAKVFSLTVRGVAATPTFSPIAGSYSSAQTVTISSTTPGASINYTTDG